MIDFESVEWKNLLSYGNNQNSFNFRTGIYKIQAKNGMGKSSIVDAIYFALFGKPYRKIKIKGLINSKNKKGLEVTLHFRIQDEVYRIERKLKPDSFKIFQNDEIVPVSSTKRGYQQILEEDILGFNENLANQVIFKSLTKSVAFMTLDKADKRSVIENLFNVELFTIINKNLKKGVDEAELKLKELKKDLDNTDLLVNQELANIENLRNLQKKLKEESDQLIEGYLKEISDLEDANVKYEKGKEIVDRKKLERNAANDLRAEVQKKISDLETKQYELEISIRANEDKVEFLKETCGNCPKIKELMTSEEVEGFKSELEKVLEKISEFKIERDAHITNIQKMNSIIDNERFLFTSLQTNTTRIAQLRNQIKVIKEKTITVDESKLKSYNTKKVELTKSYNQYSKLKKHLMVLRVLFSDDGIKPLIIKKYLPYINKLLNSYLAKFNLNVVFNFDVDFNEVILTKNKEDYCYYNFSEGEKKRIDLAILFTFIKFAMHKNKKTNSNLLIFDEIMGGLDDLGANGLFEVLKEQKDYQNKCVLTINHNSDLESYHFTGTYEVINEKGFSRIVEL